MKASSGNAINPNYNSDDEEEATVRADFQTKVQQMEGGELEPAYQPGYSMVSEIPDDCIIPNKTDEENLKKVRRSRKNVWKIFGK